MLKEVGTSIRIKPYVSLQLRIWLNNASLLRTIMGEKPPRKKGVKRRENRVVFIQFRED